MAELFPEKPDDGMFQDAVDALRRGDRARAKELLTLLLKNDQNNATYWVWMSASVDNTKERIYCLQAALKLDPENGTAKRGLILLGALAPDETIQPFQMNRPRAWEEKLLLANEKPKEKGFKAIAKSPIARLMTVVLIGVGLCSVVVFGFILPRRTNVQPTTTNTPGPSPTFTATPTLFGATAIASPTYFGPTPLWMLLPETYTPTALYVNTQRAPESIDQYRSAKIAYEKGDWDLYIQNMELILRAEPQSADVYYYIGEAYRFKGNATKALAAYNDALEVNPEFGAAYLGLARGRLMQDPNTNVEILFNEAIDRDPNFGDIYLERARYFINRNDPEAALEDLEKADQLMPESPAVYLVYAKAYLALEDTENALAAAEKAYSLDITTLEIYPLLGELYVETEQYQSAIDALELYLVYEEEDAFAFAELGLAYYKIGDEEAALRNFDEAFSLNPGGLRRFYIYRGLINLENNNVDDAVSDLERAYDYDEGSFDVNLGLVRAYYLQEKFGNAFLKVEALKSLAETDEQTALVLYWRALIQEKREVPVDAIKTWRELLKMDADVMTAEMRAEAEQHLISIVTPTNTPKAGTGTPTPRTTATKTPTRTPSKTPTP